MASMKDTLIGSKAKVKQIDQYDPTTRNALDQILQAGLGPVKQGAFSYQQYPAQGLLNQSIANLSRPYASGQFGGQNLLNQTLGALGQPFQQKFGGQNLLEATLGRLQQPLSFEPIAKRAFQRYQQEYVPSLTERFTAMGGSGGRSSALPRLLGAGAAQLASDLAAQESQFGVQQRSQEQDLLRALYSARLGEADVGLQQRGQQQDLLRSLYGAQAVQQELGLKGRGLEQDLARILLSGQLGFAGKQRDSIADILRIGLTPRTHQALIPGTTGILPALAGGVANYFIPGSGNIFTGGL